MSKINILIVSDQGLNWKIKKHDPYIEKKNFNVYNSRKTLSNASNSLFLDWFLHI